MAANDNKNEYKSGEKNMQKSYFDVLGICCSSEVPLIEKILKPLDGIKDVSVVVPSRTVIVLHDTLLISQLQIVKVLNQARLEANVRGYGEGNNYRKKWPSPFAILCGVLLLLSFLKYIYHPFQWLALAAVAVGIFPIILKAIASIRNFKFDINILMLIAVGGSIALKDYWEAGTIVFLFTTAQWLESRACHRADAVMSSLVNLVPQRAVLAESGEEVNAGEVMLNTLLAVKDGEIIPLDGIVVQGKCEVDEKTLTGESFPVPKQIDSTIWAGTINLNGYVTIKTTALAEDCVVARMATLVEEAQKNKSKTQRLIDKCTKYYTPAIVVIAICIAVVPAAIRVHNLNKWLHLALVIVVSGCPCALILSTPVATYCALSKAATSGLLIKGAEYIETLAKAKIMAFDKTGTITRGEFVVTDFQTLSNNCNMETLLYWVSSIESKSSHPMAAALVDYAKSHFVDPMPERVEEFQNFPGEGIYGRIDGKDIYVGNRKIVARSGSATVPTLEGDANEGKSIGYIFSGSSPAGIFSLSDVCRTGVKEAIKELKSMGIKTAMLTGDSQAAANYAQDQLEGGLEEVHAELLPEDKARIIKEFRKISPTAMIGDGLNDAAALATADIGISMGISGSALAMETCNIILLSNDIRKIPKAARLAKRTRRKVIENVILSFATKAFIIALAFAGHPLVWAAVLADVGTCLLVIFNSMLLLGSPRLGGKVGKSSHKHGSHDCCSSKKAEIKCTTRKCSSTHEPEKKKCSSSTEKHGGGCLHAHQLKEEKKPDHGPHSHQKGCCGTSVETKCTTPKCSPKTCSPTHKSFARSSSASCKSNKCSSLAEKHGGCLHAGTTVETKCTTQKCSNKTCPPTAHVSGHSMSSGSCKNSNKCSRSPDQKKHGGCAHAANKTKEEKKQCCSGTTTETKGTTLKCSPKTCSPKHDPPHLCSTSCENNKTEKHGPEEAHQHCEHGNHSHLSEDEVHHDHVEEPRKVHCGSHHCRSTSTDHVQDYITEEEIGNMVKECCKYYPSSNHHHDVHLECNNQGSDYNRHIGGCCNSFRKECCGKNPHFGVGFAGGLSEIVIE